MGSVSDYDKAFTELIFQIDDMSPSEMFHAFRYGLKSHIQEKMDEMGITSDLRALKIAATKFDDLKFYHKTSSLRTAYKKPFTR